MGQVTDTAVLQNGVLAFFKNVRLNFKDSANVGKIEGHSFCNAIGGTYKISDKNKITTSDIGGTKVDCLYEGKLWGAFRAASSYKRNNDTLCILYNKDSEEMVFVRDKQQVKDDENRNEIKHFPN